MADLVFTVFTSLDGYIEKPGGVFAPPPWSEEVEKAWSHAALSRAKHLIYGRVNFQFNKGFWSAAETDPTSVAAGIDYAPTMNALPKTVLSRTLAGDPGWNGRIAGPDIAAEIAALKREVTGGDIFAFSGAGAAETLFGAGLVDEFWLMITPELFGDGKRLFREGRPPSTMRLVDSRTLDVGSVILRYRKAA
jgi:dihydrofolate reductase